MSTKICCKNLLQKSAAQISAAQSVAQISAADHFVMEEPGDCFAVSHRTAP